VFRLRLYYNPPAKALTMAGIRKYVCIIERGCTGFDWYDSGYKLQVERPSPDWAKH